MKRLSLITVLLVAALGCLRAEVSLFLGDCVAQRGDTAEIHLYMSDAATVTAFQVDVTLPQGSSLLKATLSPEEGDHALMTKHRGSDGVRMGCWSPTNAPFATESGCIATLTVLFPAGMLGGTYTLETSSPTVVYPNGGKKTLSSTKATVWVSEADERDKSAQLFTEYPTSQAFCLQNTSSSRWLTLNASASKVTIEDACDVEDAQFFLEPAFDAGEECYYLRNAKGYYLNLAMAASTIRIGVTETPSASAAVRLVLTGERTYAIVHATGRQPMGTASTSAGAVINMKNGASYTGWKLWPAEATWNGDALKHMAQKASTCIDLTKGYADLALRIAIHQVQKAVGEEADAAVLSALAEQLKTAVAEARAAQANGDTTVATVPWGTPETLPATEYMVSMTDEKGNRLYLAYEDGQPRLTDMLTICTLSIQDIFYNPYTDRYALRLEGEGDEGEGLYLAYNPEDGTFDTASRSEGERLRIWQVQTVAEAMTNDMVRAGSCGPKANWRFDPETRTLYITGSERTAYYSSADSTPWSIYRHLIKQVVLTGEFTMMGSYLLAGCTSLTRLTITASKAPSLGTNTLEGVPEGLEIRALYPDAYADFVPGSQVSSIATIKDSYIYNGQPQKPQVECDFETTLTTSAMQTNVGTYTTTATIRIYIENVSYTLTVPFTYTIQPATLIATTRDISRNYGTKNPRLTVVIEGLAGTDTESSVLAETPVASCEADKQSPVGDYPIVLSGGALKNDNYTLVLQPSVLTVKPARLTVRVQDATRREGEPNPTFTCTYSGFVNGEDESVITVQPTITTDADEHSAPGLYDIVASGGEAPNYELRYVTGILTVQIGAGVEPLMLPEAPEQIYDLQGRAVGEDSATLPAGVYVKGGCKFVVK